MVAEVIPYRRTIRGVDAFDYSIPDELLDAVAVGTTVWIPFRNKTIVGVVRRITDAEPNEKTKAIDSVHSTQLWSDRIPLLEWFSRYYGISLASALKSMQFPLLKRPKKIELEYIEGALELSVATQIADSLSRTTKAIIDAERTILAQYRYRSDCIALYSLLAKKVDGNMLVVVPEYGAAEELKTMHVESRQMICIPEAASSSFMTALLEVLSERNDLIIVGTKKTSFLPLNLFALAILDQEEAHSHKQFDSNPRYHTRSVLLRAQQDTETQLLFTSPAPSIQSYAITLEEEADYMDMTRDRVAGQLTLVNMEHEYEAQNYSWFSSALQQRIAAGGRHLLLLNRTGSFRFAQCNDCSELLELNVTQCENCKSADIKKYRRGTEQIERDLREMFPQKNILRVDRTVEDEEIDAQRLDTADIIIGTEKALRTSHAADFDSIAVLSVDHLLVYPHFRSHERVFHLLSHILSYSTPVLIQTHAPKHPVIETIRTGDYDRFAFNELSARKLLKLPPYADRIRLLDTQARTATLAAANVDLTTLPPTIHIDRE